MNNFIYIYMDELPRIPLTIVFADKDKMAAVKLDAHISGVPHKEALDLFKKIQEQRKEMGE